MNEREIAARKSSVVKGIGKGKAGIKRQTADAIIAQQGRRSPVFQKSVVVSTSSVTTTTRVSSSTVQAPPTLRPELPLGLKFKPKLRVRNI